GINGFDLCTLLRRDQSTTTIPIIVVTGDAYEADIRRAKRAGADAVLTKPCVPELLLDEIRKNLQKAVELRQRGDKALEQIAVQIERSHELRDQTRAALFERRTNQSHTYERRQPAKTTSPPRAQRSPHVD